MNYKYLINFINLRGVEENSSDRMTSLLHVNRHCIAGTGIFSRYSVYLSVVGTAVSGTLPVFRFSVLRFILPGRLPEKSSTSKPAQCLPSENR